MKRRILCLYPFLLVSALVFAQATNPVPQNLPYTQDFSALLHDSTLFPAGWAGWQMADAPNTSFNTAPPIGNQNIFASSSAENNMGGIHNYNGKLGFLNMSTYVYTTALAISTTGLQSIRVKYDIMTIRNPFDYDMNTRYNEVILQYRIGSSGPFNSILGSEYANGDVQQIGIGVTDPQSPASVSVFLPEVCNNKPIVQVRWVARDVSGLGDRPSFAIDNVSIREDLSPVFEIDPTSVYFGHVEVGNSISNSVYVINTGVNPGTITAATIVGSGAYTLGAFPTLPHELAGSGVAAAEFPVIFQPVAAGLHEANLVLSFAWDESGSAQTDQQVIPLTGEGLADPEMSVAPDPLHVTQQELSIGTETVTISNGGAGELTFEIDPVGFPAWLSVAPLSGTVLPGGNVQLTVSLDTNSLAPNPPGTAIDDAYAYDIGIMNNDPVIGFYTLPVRLLVTPLPIFVDFEGDPLIGQGSLEVWFTDQSRLSADMASATITGWRWDFENDGIIDSYEQDPMHLYPAPGEYSVKLTILTSTGVQRSKLKANYVNVNNNAPMIVTPLDSVDMQEDLVWGPYDLYTIFTDPDSEVLTFSAINSPNIFVNIEVDEFTLSATKDWYGTENIELIATDPWGASATHTVVVTVNSVNDAPVLSIPDTLYFIRNSHYTINFGEYIEDPDNPLGELSISIVSISMNNQIEVVHEPGVPGQQSATFSAPLDWFGTGRFRITVNDHTFRAISQAEFDMVVLEFFTPQVATDVPADDVNTYYQYSGQAVQFFDHTLGNPDWWIWNFGDGNSSTQPNPVHTYMNPGTYSVSLTLRNNEAGPASQAMQQNAITFTFAGTAVYNTSTVTNWSDPSYNLFGDAAFDADMNIGGLQPVEIVVFNPDPVVVAANVNFTNATFRPPAGNPTWAGLQFSGNYTPSLNGCIVRGAEIPIRISGGNPSILNSQIATSDTLNQLGETGLLIEGEASPILSNIEIISYRNGLVLENLDRNRVSTPTLTNVRVRNSTQSSRNEERPTGIDIKGDVDVSMDDVVVDNFDTGLKFENTSLAVPTTPTLTNVRVRNSTQSSRTNSFGTIGIEISGNVFPSMNDVEIDSVQTGIIYTDAIAPPREPASLTNVTVRRRILGPSIDSAGAYLSNVSALVMDDCEFDGFSQGMVISTDDTRAVSTPTLTNVRVRNSTQSSRNPSSVGLDISGNVILGMTDSSVDDYDLGIRYDGGALSTRLSTPTLTNVRVRNSTQSSRNLRMGIQLIDLINIVMENDSIVGYHTGLEISTTESRTVSTPTLTNVRVRNSTQSTRDENVGFFLGEGVAGVLQESYVEGASVGILIAQGNQTQLIRNLIKNCEIGIRASSFSDALPLQRQEFHLTQAFMNLYPGFMYRAFDLLFTGPWSVTNNTIYGYPKALTASDAEVTFINNIVWGHVPVGEPYTLTSSDLQQSYNNINYMGGIYPGSGNINALPLFMDAEADNFHLHYNSPCIDTGDPLSPPDEDGTVADIGARAYLHKVDFIPSERFVLLNTAVQFQNLSYGHEHGETLVEWDVGNDGIVESTNRNFEYIFDQSGWYDIRLKMTTGLLVDELVYENMIVVQQYQLMAPEQVSIGKVEANMHLQWQPVSFSIDEIPLYVNYYLVYWADEPDGLYRFLANTEAPVTEYLDPLDPDIDARFYIVIGFYGSRAELDRYILENPQRSFRINGRRR